MGEHAAGTRTVSAAKHPLDGTDVALLGGLTEGADSGLRPRFARSATIEP